MPAVSVLAITSVPSLNVHVRLTTVQYDAVHTEARASRLTIPEWIRRRLSNQLITGKTPCL